MSAISKIKEAVANSADAPDPGGPRNGYGDTLKDSWQSYVRPVRSLPANVPPHSRFMEPTCRAFPSKDANNSEFAGEIYVFVSHSNQESLLGLYFQV